MDWYRLRHTIGMMCNLSALDRAEYARKHNIFFHIGSNCMLMLRKIPLYPKLISMQDNVWIAQGVTFLTHDVIYCMLNYKNGGDGFKENINCIDIRENVFIGSNVTICMNVRIGPNVIVGAGSLVNKDISDGVYAGSPVHYICSIDEFEKKRLGTEIPIEKRNWVLSDKTVKEAWRKFKGIRHE